MIISSRHARLVSKVKKTGYACRHRVFTCQLRLKTSRFAGYASFFRDASLIPEKSAAGSWYLAGNRFAS
ncbi:Uncharacterised protein [Citrobacter koseri]|uniref:Uncharacterized protein n=1 Tax=Citrobacter koseri TaxID=545 RepID=A0A2X2WJQ3_CITKO|nr:Uncharacterised protein [Citrobacter koseri]